MSRVVPSGGPRRQLPAQRADPHLADATLRLTDEDIDRAVASEVASKILVHNMQEQIKDLKDRADQANHLRETIDRRFDGLGEELRDHIKVVQKIAIEVGEHQRLFESVDLRGLSEAERRAVPKTLRMGISMEKFTRGFRLVLAGLTGLLIAAGAVVEIIRALVGTSPTP